MTGEQVTSPPLRRRVPVRLLLFGAVSVVSVAVGFLIFNAQEARHYVQRFGYHTITGTFAWALFALWRIAPELIEPWRRLTPKQRWSLLGVVLGCAGVAAATTPWNYKVLYDEMVLQATAWHLHYFREIGTLLRGYHVDGVFAPFDTYLDKRPFFFAYLVSLLHDLTGYREGNAFALNFALMPAILLQVYAFARNWSAHAGALAAVVTFGTLSLLAHNATGSGMEMLNLAMLLLGMQVATRYLDAPNEKRLAALVLVVVLLAQTRYESSLYVGSAALVVLEGWRRARRIILPPAAIAGPALLVPYALHNTYLSGTPLLWELPENTVARFGSSHVVANLQHAANYLFGASSLSTNSWWLSVAGLLALGLAMGTLWRARRRWRDAPAPVLVCVFFGAAIVGNLSLLMFYYWGQLDDPIVGRLSLPFSVLLVLALAFAIQRWDAPQRRLPWVAAGGALAAALSGGLAANGQHTGLNTLGDELTWEQRVIEARPPGERLILTNKSSLPWMLRNCPAVLISHARRRVDALRYHLESETFSEVLVLQRYVPVGASGGFQLDPRDRLPDSWQLEPVQERRIGARIARISRLTRIAAEPAAGP